MPVIDALKKVLGSANERAVSRLRGRVTAVNALREEMSALSDGELRAKTDEFRRRLSDGETEDDILVPAFAVVREAAHRVFNDPDTVARLFGSPDAKRYHQFAFDVQLIGGIVLHEGNIAEMVTGEGKTLVAVFPAYLNALSGQGVHIITVNDFLARRDATWMGAVYEFLGLTCGALQNDMSPPDRREMYARDIVYGTNSEFGFDYLRDNMALRSEQMVQRELHYAIVDEVDSILIDEARTPLIISGPVEGETDIYERMQPSVDRLHKQQQRVMRKLLEGAERSVREGKLDEAARPLYQVRLGDPKNPRFLKLLEEPKVRDAMQRFHRDVAMDSGAFGTGELVHELEDELYYAMEEDTRSIHPTQRGWDLLSQEDAQLTSITGSVEAAEEASRRRREVETDPRLSDEEKRQAVEDMEREYDERLEKLHAIQQLVTAYALYHEGVQYIINETGVVIVDEFTGRLQPGRRWSDGLHQAVEAKERVSVQQSFQTLATITIQNYFRMYDKLSGMTGTAATEAGEFANIYKLEVVQIPTARPMHRLENPDVIYQTAEEKWEAVLEEIVDKYKEGRPVLVGTVSVEKSERLSQVLHRRNVLHSVLNAKNHEREADIITLAGQESAVTISTNMAGRGTDIVLGPGVAEVGGLHVVGTERHESRRIDLQLRGRAGRLGDPGSSRFFLSLEDDLMRIFAGQRVASLMSRLGWQRGEPLESKMVTRSIATAQKNVELNNFEIRKQLLRYDDVMNKQRTEVYAWRQSVLRGESQEGHLHDIVEDLAERYLDVYAPEETYPDDWRPDDLRLRIRRVFGVTVVIPTGDEVIARDDLLESIVRELNASYAAREEALGADVVRDLEGMVMLYEVDRAWRDHLLAMDQLREAVRYESYGGKDPFLEYSVRAHDAFFEMESRIKERVAHGAFTLVPRRREGAPPAQPEPARMVEKQESYSAFEAGGARKAAAAAAAAAVGGGEAGPAAPSQGAGPQPGRAPRRLSGPQRPDQTKVTTYKRDVPKVGRNDPCPCGSGKKYKKCCGR